MESKRREEGTDGGQTISISSHSYPLLHDCHYSTGGKKGAGRGRGRVKRREERRVEGEIWARRKKIEEENGTRKK